MKRYALPTKSLTPVTTADCGLLQFAAEKVKLAGETVPSVVSLLCAAVLFGIAYRQRGCVGPLPARTALTTLCLVSPLLLHHVISDVSFPFKPRLAPTA